MIRCAWNASSMHEASMIVLQLHSDTAPYCIRKVDFNKKFLRKQLYCFVLKTEYCETVKNSEIREIMTFKNLLHTFSREK